MAMLCVHAYTRLYGICMGFPCTSNGVSFGSFLHELPYSNHCFGKSYTLLIEMAFSAYFLQYGKCWLMPTFMSCDLIMGVVN